jgi:hypothetical protein
VAEIVQGYGVHPRREASGRVAFLFFVQYSYTGGRQCAGVQTGGEGGRT